MYLSGIAKISNPENTYKCYRNFEEFIDHILSLEKGSILYAHNLGFDYAAIFGFMKTNPKYADVDFSELITGMSKKVIRVKLIRRGKTIELRDSQSLFGTSLEKVLKGWLPEYEEMRKGEVEYYEHYPENISKEMLEYFYVDVVGLANALKVRIKLGAGKLTTSSDAKELIKETIEDKFSHLSDTPFTTVFPNLDLDVDKDLRKYYKGGYCFVNPRYKNVHIKEKVCVYDINSMYPHHMETDNMPIGKPVKFTGEPIDSKLYVVSIIVEYLELKDNCPPFLVNGSKTSFFSINYVENLSNKDDEKLRTFHLTKMEYELMLDFYNTGKITFIGGYYFNFRNDLFKPFVSKFREMKENNTGGKRESAKLFLNGPSGKFGQNPDSETYESYLDSECIQRFRVKDEDKRKEAFYLPISIFTTAYSRVGLLRQINKVGMDKFIYCDTDSIHCFYSEDTEKLFDLHDTKFGCWKNEGVAEESLYIRPKRNCKLKDGKLMFTCAGVHSKWFKDFKKVTDFKEGVKVDVMRMVQAPGGKRPKMIKITI